MPVRKKHIVRKERSKTFVRKNGVTVKTTSKECWKGFERKVSADFGTRRVPLSGSNSGHSTNSDSLHPSLYIECKVRESFSFWKLFEDTEKKALVEKKTPIVAIKEKGKKGYLLIIRPDDMDKILEQYKKFE